MILNYIFIIILYRIWVEVIIFLLANMCLNNLATHCRYEWHSSGIGYAEDVNLIGYAIRTIKKKCRYAVICYVDLKRGIHVRVIQSKHFCPLDYSRRIKISTIIILPVVLDGCDAWSLTLREESRLRVFENRILRSGEGSTMRNFIFCTDYLI